MSLFLASYKRVALALGLPQDRSKLELVRLASRKSRAAQPIPPKDGFQGARNRERDNRGGVDLFNFPRCAVMGVMVFITLRLAGGILTEHPPSGLGALRG